MAGKRTDSNKKNKAKLTPVQTRYQKRAKTVIQPKAEEKACCGKTLEEHLKNTPESDDRKIIDAYEELLKDDIKGRKGEKKLLSLILVLALIFTAVAVIPTAANAAEVFQEGDELFLKVELWMLFI